ncbi:hypothetical protein DS745_06925 [Anaerobacillus alkaliphilus]|uniref:DUF4367 domain-containing protein n=1 Tax=Anaerobacillus alkaliphilus TaxID=1548597 RepID=A0A4Q0VW68_9BACI|nr:hypothetical protein [Anaerobacillus alkaliphilus]RXJ02429.1 hypothetical protein DS745_06925 [Anaerobacillus alkaliphilus]
MEEKNVDKEIKASLLKNTDDASRQKEDIWAQIESKLDLKTEEIPMKLEPRSTRRNTNHKKSKGWLTGTIAAAVLLGIFTTSTDTGQAFVSSIREYFAPEKTVVEEIEGMPEEKEVVLKEGKAGYIIYIDEERYSLIQEGDMDKVVFNQELSDIYPEVSMSIRQIEDKTPEVVAEEVHAELTNSFATVDEITPVTDPVEGLLVSAIDGNEWDSVVRKVYVVSNEKEGSFVIEQRYFLEASEGHGARFHHMLREFQVVEIEE